MMQMGIANSRSSGQIELQELLWPIPTTNFPICLFLKYNIIDKLKAIPSNLLQWRLHYHLARDAYQSILGISFVRSELLNLFHS